MRQVLSVGWVEKLRSADVADEGVRPGCPLPCNRSRVEASDEGNALERGERKAVDVISWRKEERKEDGVVQTDSEDGM